MLATLSAFLFFGSVVLHELGHAVVARRNGIETHGIDLWLLGGLARLAGTATARASSSASPRPGPLVTLVFGLACYGARAGAVRLGRLRRRARASRRTARSAPARPCSPGSPGSTLVLLVFNLIPGFPLDGGRMARAIAWWRTGDRAKATRFASRARPGVRLPADRLRPLRCRSVGDVALARLVRLDGLLHHPGGARGRRPEPDHGADRGAARVGRDGRGARLRVRRS